MFRRLRMIMGSGTMLAGNVILFLPLGLFLPIVTGRRGWRTVLSAAVVAPVLAAGGNER